MESELRIPNTFENYKERILQSGVETMSETTYKSYIIQLRCYNFSGITGKIIKVLSDGKKKVLKQKAYNFKQPIEFLNELKTYIDNHEVNLINKLQ